MLTIDNVTTKYLARINKALYIINMHSHISDENGNMNNDLFDIGLFMANSLRAGGCIDLFCASIGSSR